MTHMNTGELSLIDLLRSRYVLTLGVITSRLSQRVLLHSIRLRITSS